MASQPADSALKFGLSTVPRPALLLGFAGLIPFIALALAANFAAPPEALPARRALAVYGAVILSFMGGCRWGFASADRDEGPSLWRLGVSTVPALLAWGAIVAGTTPGLWITAMCHVALFAADVTLTRAGGAPNWWPALRLPLTVIAAASLVAAA